MNVQRRTSWTLPDDLAAEVERLIADGVVQDIAEIVANGLSAIEDRPAAFDDATLLRAVKPVLDRLDRDPGGAIPFSEAVAELDRRIARRRGER
jgi:Arc/MetJ-type ribon-helix-helix transcriptional regulator